MPSTTRQFDPPPAGGGARLSCAMRAGVLAILTVLLLCAAASVASARELGNLAEVAPTLTKQPVNVTATEAASATFTATASGTSPLTSQWERSTNTGATWSAYEGTKTGNSSSLTIGSVQFSETGYQFRVTYSNKAGRATSTAATLTVDTIPAVTEQPSAATVTEGQSATFKSAASGVPSPTVQWEYSSTGGSSWRLVSGATSATLTISATKSSENGYQYRATWTNAAGKTSSLGATLNVQTAPVVTKQPTTVTVETGSSASFESTASGVPAPSVQWEVSSNGGSVWTPVPGATSTKLTIASASNSENDHLFRAVFSNGAGTVKSSPAALFVQQPPRITEQPTSETVNEGQTATFTASASAFPAPGVNWEYSTNGGATWTSAGDITDVLTISSVKGSESGREYRATFSNSDGSATTTVATLTVNTIPVVTRQPANATAVVGQNATFEAAATSSPSPSVQWEESSTSGSSWAPIEGATSTALTVPVASLSENGDEYRAVFSNVAGSAATSAAVLSVQQPPAVTEQPVSAAVNEGQSATFSSAASGFPAPTVQWELSTNEGVNWRAISGATSPTLTVSAVKLSESGNEYRATWTNGAGQATSSPATLSVRHAPVLVHQPQSTTVEAGESATFEATASGFPAPAVQWEVSTSAGSSWTPIEGATSGKLTVSAATVSENEYEYRAVFTNVVGSATSSAAVLTVHQVPIITEQPSSITVEEGQAATFTAAAFGLPTPTVQWEYSSNKGGTWLGLSGQTSTTLTISSPKTSEDGREYRASFKNVAGKTSTAAATMTVHKAPSVVKQPVAVIIEAGKEATFESTGAGYPTPSEQWEVSADGGNTWSAVEGATSAKLSLPGTGTSQDGNLYRAVFTNAAGTATSTAAKLSVYILPTVTNPPVSTNVEEGQSATFEATGAGYPAPSIQWELSVNEGATWAAVAGATSETLTVTAVKHSQNNDQYRAVFSNYAGRATSEPALLTIGPIYNTNAWGQNLYGQLGNGSSEAFSDTPVPVKGITDVAQIAAGAKHSLVLLDSGAVEAWGDNAYGQLGGAEPFKSTVPIPVPTLKHGVTAIAAGENHSLALLSNGTVVAWGDNEEGQLGLGNTKEASGPQPVKGLTGITAIAAGGNFSLALTSKGTVYAWGENSSGQLGVDTKVPSSTPQLVHGLSGVSRIAAGEDFALALLSNGTAMGWGDDTYNELSNEAINGSETETEGISKVPVTVEGLTGATAIAAGAQHALALLSNGTVVGWGADSKGQVGNGSAVLHVDKPTAIGGLTGVKAIAAGGAHSVALLSNHTVMDWGENERGILGIGTSGGISDVPVAVPGISGVTGIAAGLYHTITFGVPTPTVLLLSPNIGPTAGGTAVRITGAHLESTSQVDFGSTPATSFTINSPSSVTAIEPAGAAGTVDVTVTTSAGTSPPVKADRFTFIPPPEVTKLSVKEGPVTGGNTVTLTGLHLATVSAVRFGTAPATNVVVNSETSVTVTAPAGTSGSIYVTVASVGGTSTPQAKDHYGYDPVVEAVSPATGPAAGGETVTITGQGFALGTSASLVKFGTTKSKSVDCTSSTSCTALVPAHAAGTVDVRVEVEKETSAASPPADSYTYE